MNVYLWLKICHLFSVMLWLATVFSLPRLLLSLAESENDPTARARLGVLGRRFYRLGHHAFGVAVLLGLVLWLYCGIGGGWLHIKLVLVVLLLGYFTLCGRWLKGAAEGRALPSRRALWWFSQAPWLPVAGVLWLVLAKPFP